MENRDQRIYEEAAALWQELFREPPPVKTDGAMMLDIIMRSLPMTEYERLRSPFLRPSNITGPVSHS